MANRQSKVQMRALLDTFMADMASDDISMFAVRESRYGFWCESSLLFMEPGENYTAHFSIFFPWDEPLNNFNLMFTGPKSQYLNRKFNLKEYVTERIWTSIKWVNSIHFSSPNIHTICFGVTCLAA